MSLRGLGKRESGTIDGATPLLLLNDSGGSTPHRRAIQFSNCDAGRIAFLRMTPAGASAPALSSTNFDFAVGPRATLILDASEYVEVWAINDSGSVATSPYAATEVLD